MHLPGQSELQAAERLLSRGAAGRTDSRAAAQHVWRAMFHRDDWPSELQKSADKLKPLLFKYGTIDMTISNMSDAELTDLRAALSEFVAAAEPIGG